MSFKDLRQVLFLSYEENMISDKEVLLLCDEYSRRTQNLNLWFQPENSRFEVRSAAQECLDMRSGCHAAKILPVGVRGTKNDWCLSSLIESYSNDDGEGI